MAAPESLKYTLDMAYNSDHTIKKKTQEHREGIVTSYEDDLADIQRGLSQK